MAQRIMPETTEVRLPNSLIEMSFPEIETAPMEKGNPTMLPLLNFHTKTCTTKTVPHIHIFTLYIYIHTHTQKLRTSQNKETYPTGNKSENRRKPINKDVSEIQKQTYFWLFRIVFLCSSCCLFVCFLFCFWVVLVAEEIREKKLTESNNNNKPTL